MMGDKKQNISFLTKKIITEETTTMKEKLREYFGVEYKGTDPIQDSIAIDII